MILAYFEILSLLGVGTFLVILTLVFVLSGVLQAIGIVAEERKHWEMTSTFHEKEL